MPTAWIVPKKNKSTLVKRAETHGYRDGVPPLVDVGTVAMPPLAPHVLDIAEDTLVFAENSSVVLVRGLTSGSPSTLQVKLPKGSEIHAVTLIDGVVYAGGRGNSEVLGTINLRGEPRWEPMGVPPNVLTPGKGVDGFALHNGKLIAVDDMIVPRFLLLYDVTDARAPRFLEVRDLPSHSTYEHVTSVASNDRALALLSTTVNHALFLVHVSLLDLATLEERAVLHGTAVENVRSSSLPVADFHSIAIVEDTLLIAAGESGIAMLTMNPWLESGAREKNASEARGESARKARKEKTLEVPWSELRFVPVNGKRVVRVAPVDSASAFAITETKTGILKRTVLDSSLVPLR